MSENIMMGYARSINERQSFTSKEEARFTTLQTHDYIYT